MDHWASILRAHPIFKIGDVGDSSFNLSSLEATLPKGTSPSSVQNDGSEDALPPKRKAMVVRENDIIVAIGSQLRVACVEPGASKSYTTLQAPELDFDIQMIALNSSRNLLAVAGDTRVVVVVLPRAGALKAAGGHAECKVLPVGRMYHAARGTSPIAEVDWHPLGEAGASLVVLTRDGKLREYDVSTDPEEPTQTISFASEKKTRSYAAEDPFARQAVSFTFGQGDGDWSLLTLYAAMRNGDIYAICPFLPTNATLPSSYLFALDGFVAEKRQFLTIGDGATTSSLASMYEQQRLFTTALLQQIPPDTKHDSISTPVSIRAPKVKKRLQRQGPFLLQPAPKMLPGETGETTDILYLSLGGTATTTDASSAGQIGVLVVANQDGRTDICLDLEKVEAQWEGESRDGLPALVVYETIDLGLVQAASLAKIDLAEVNHPVLMVNPVHDEALYIYHTFGAHSLDLSEMMLDLSKALTQENASETTPLPRSRGTVVCSLSEPVSPQSKPDPVVALGIPSDSFSTSSILILTQSANSKIVPLVDRGMDAERRLGGPSAHGTSLSGVSTDAKPAYVSLLSASPFVPPAALRQSYSTMAPQIIAPSTPKTTFTLTAASLRQLSTTVENFQKHMQAVQLAQRETEARAALQRQEYARQRQEHAKVLALLHGLRTKRQDDAQRKLDTLRAKHADMIKCTETVLKRLMLRASPELNEHETRWFHELSRMKEEVFGMDKYDDQSLGAKADRLRLEVERLVPRLNDIRDQEPERWQLVSKTDSLGASQAFQLGSRSQSELASIRSLEKQVAGLAAKLDVSLTQTPVALSGA